MKFHFLEHGYLNVYAEIVPYAQSMRFNDVLSLYTPILFIVNIFCLSSHAVGEKKFSFIQLSFSSNDELRSTVNNMDTYNQTTSAELDIRLTGRVYMFYILQIAYNTAFFLTEFQDLDRSL